MKYMTAELLARFRSPDDNLADKADEEWERQCQAYTDHLKQIDHNLTSGARRLLRRYNLHDAKVLAMVRDEVPFFSFFLEMEDSSESDGKKRLEIRYRLVGGGKGFDVISHPDLANDGPSYGWWLYDEIDVAETAPLMTHSVLLTGGKELVLTFFSVSVRRLDFLSLADENGVINPKTAGQWMPLNKSVRIA